MSNPLLEQYKWVIDWAGHIIGPFNSIIDAATFADKSGWTRFKITCLDEPERHDPDNWVQSTEVE